MKHITYITENLLRMMVPSRSVPTSWNLSLTAELRLQGLRYQTFLHKISNLSQLNRLWMEISNLICYMVHFSLSNLIWKQDFASYIHYHVSCIFTSNLCTLSSYYVSDVIGVLQGVLKTQMGGGRKSCANITLRDEAANVIEVSLWDDYGK